MKKSNDIPKNHSINDINKTIDQNNTAQTVELITELIIDAVKEHEKMEGKIKNGTEIKMNKNIGNETLEKYPTDGIGGIVDGDDDDDNNDNDSDNDGNNDGDKMNLSIVVKPIIRDLIVEMKKHLAKKEHGLSLFGAIQRAIGDFWVAFVNTSKTINNFLDLLFAPISAALKTPIN
uniref:Uncharacterized protein n=2 Tax=Loa loa TaxID=7209 RepID=A0A1I7W2N2_LOALO